MIPPCCLILSSISHLTLNHSAWVRCLKTRPEPQCFWCITESIHDINGKSVSLIIYQQGPEDVTLDFSWFEQSVDILLKSQKRIVEMGISRELEMREEIFYKVSMGIRLLIHVEWLLQIQSMWVGRRRRRRYRAAELYATKNIKRHQRHSSWPSYSQNLLKVTRHMQIYRRRKGKESYVQNKNNNINWKNRSKFYKDLFYSIRITIDVLASLLNYE